MLEMQYQSKAGAFIHKEKSTIYTLASNLIEEQFALNEIRQTSCDRKIETLKAIKPIYDIDIDTAINNTTKTKAGTRTLKVNSELIQFLRKCIGDKKQGLIFVSSNNNPVNTCQVNYQYMKILDRYHILDNSICGKVDLHSLRHTFATRCIESGMPAKVVQKVLGHTDISITLDTYCDVFDKYAEDNLKIADAYMSEHNISLS